LDGVLCLFENIVFPGEQLSTEIVPLLLVHEGLFSGRLIRGHALPRRSFRAGLVSARALISALVFRGKLGDRRIVIPTPAGSCALIRVIRSARCRPAAERQFPLFRPSHSERPRRRTADQSARWFVSRQEENGPSDDMPALPIARYAATVLRSRV
jgi:hypothetical protein